MTHPSTVADTLDAGDGWIEWAGGECPVPADTRVEARWYADGTFLTDIGAARSFVWWNQGKPRDPTSGDIVAYRVVQP